MQEIAGGVYLVRFSYVEVEIRISAKINSRIPITMNAFFAKAFTGYTFFRCFDGVMKSIAYFDDAEQEPMPFMLKEKSWNDIKKQILKEI